MNRKGIMAYLKIILSGRIGFCIGLSRNNTGFYGFFVPLPVSHTLGTSPSLSSREKANAGGGEQQEDK